MNLDLTGKHALVGGGSKGIGGATAVALAELGADVTLLARDPATLATAVVALPKRDTQRHGFIAVDMSDRAALAAKVQALVNQHAIHILINNTGGPPAGSALGASDAEFEAAFAQHLLANQTLVRIVFAGMRDHGYGRIVNVISTSVKEPIRGLGVSNTVRGAVASWAKTLAMELGVYGITVNNVLPGYTQTERLDAIIEARSKTQPTAEVERAMLASVPLGRFAQASETAAAIAFLCSPAASYINGVNLPVDGGRTLSL
jgi:3-oxoacyl-[acyl-carrier protein] reductase